MNHNEIIRILKRHAIENDEILGLFAIGSYARKELEPYSDLDLVILSKKTPSLIFESVSQLFGDQIKYLLEETDRKQSFFIGNQLIKVELSIIKDFEEIKKLYIGSRIREPSNSILVDKTGALSGKLSPFKETQSSEEKVELINKEINKFLISFETASSMAKREDVFQSYFHYNLSLTRYMRLLQLALNDVSFLYVPKKIMERLTSNQHRRVERLNGSLTLYELRGKLERLATEFRELHSILYHENEGIEKNPEFVRNYIADILDRDLVWNFRDVSWTNPALIHDGRLFRSSALSRFSNTRAFDKLINENGIKRIIDLRQEWEVDRYPYEGVEIDIQHRPVFLSPNGEYENESVYRALLFDSLQMRSIFTLISEGKTTVITCSLGRDRTGFVISLILLAIGVPIELVEKDFLASHMGITKKEFRRILDYIESKGGIQELMYEYEVTPETIEKIRDWLIINE